MSFDLRGAHWVFLSAVLDLYLGQKYCVTKISDTEIVIPLCHWATEMEKVCRFYQLFGYYLVGWVLF